MANKDFAKAIQKEKYTDGKMKKKSKPKNKSLYSSIKSEAKRKFDVYPSAYANIWISKQYKKRNKK